MAGRAQVTVLAHCRIRADPNSVHAIAIHERAQVTALIHLQIPWRPNPRARIDPHTSGNLRPKTAQEEPTPAETNTGTWPKQQQPYHAPCCPRSLLPEAEPTDVLRKDRFGSSIGPRGLRWCGDAAHSLNSDLGKVSFRAHGLLST